MGVHNTLGRLPLAKYQGRFQEALNPQSKALVTVAPPEASTEANAERLAVGHLEGLVLDLSACTAVFQVYYRRLKLECANPLPNKSIGNKDVISIMST